MALNIDNDNDDAQKDQAIRDLRRAIYGLLPPGRFDQVLPITSKPFLGHVIVFFFCAGFPSIASAYWFGFALLLEQYSTEDLIINVLVIFGGTFVTALLFSVGIQGLCNDDLFVIWLEGAASPTEILLLEFERNTFSAFKNEKLSSHGWWCYPRYLLLDFLIRILRSRQSSAKGKGGTAKKHNYQQVAGATGEEDELYEKMHELLVPPMLVDNPKGEECCESNANNTQWIYGHGQWDANAKWPAGISWCHIMRRLFCELLVLSGGCLMLISPVEASLSSVIWFWRHHYLMGLDGDIDDDDYDHARNAVSASKTVSVSLWALGAIGWLLWHTMQQMSGKDADPWWRFLRHRCLVKA